MLPNRFPEELLVEQGGARGLTVHLHRLAWHSIEMAAVVAHGDTVTVVRREARIGADGALGPGVDERFDCRLCFLAKLERQLARLGVAEAKPFVAEDVLDGEFLACRYRAASGELHWVSLFCWGECPEPAVRRLGDYLRQLARSPVRVLRRRAWLSRFR